MFSEENKQICRLFAEVLEYPGVGTVGSAIECAHRLEGNFPDISKRMQLFAKFAQKEGRGKLEEEYTQTFDTTPATTLYLGYHLFGDTPKRSALMVKLQQAYQDHGFSAGTELADHICAVLRFLPVAKDVQFVTPLLQECALPVLEKIERAFPKKNAGYALAVKSLRSFLKRASSELAKPGGQQSA